jgi:asparagine synthase (glutamine-hydrolysing)
VLRSADVCLRLIADGNRDLLKIPTDRGVAGPRGAVLGSLSRGLLEFSFKAEYAYDMGMPQRVAQVDHLFSALHLERLFLGRHKVFHFRIWYRDFLAQYVREMLLDSRSLCRPYIDRKGVTAIVEGHLRGSQNFTNEIHKLLTLELIHRTFIDTPETGIFGGRHDASISVAATG